MEPSIWQKSVTKCLGYMLVMWSKNATKLTLHLLHKHNAHKQTISLKFRYWWSTHTGVVCNISGWRELNSNEFVTLKKSPPVLSPQHFRQEEHDFKKWNLYPLQLNQTWFFYFLLFIGKISSFQITNESSIENVVSDHW